MKKFIVAIDGVKGPLKITCSDLTVGSECVIMTTNKEDGDGYFSAVIPLQRLRCIVEEQSVSNGNVPALE